MDSGGLKEAWVQSYSAVVTSVHNFNRIRQVAPIWSHGKAHWHHLVNTIEPSIFGSDAVLCQMILITCLYSCAAADKY